MQEKAIGSLSVLFPLRMSIDWGSINSEVDLKLHWPPDPWSALETEWARREEALDTIQTQLEGPEETLPVETNIEWDATPYRESQH